MNPNDPLDELPKTSGFLSTNLLRAAAKAQNWNFGLQNRKNTSNCLRDKTVKPPGRNGNNKTFTYVRNGKNMGKLMNNDEKWMVLNFETLTAKPLSTAQKTPQLASWPATHRWEEPPVKKNKKKKKTWFWYGGTSGYHVFWEHNLNFKHVPSSIEKKNI